MAEDEAEVLPCVECDMKATYYCVDCDNFYFCTLCFDKIHSFNIFKRHVRQPIEISPCKEKTPLKGNIMYLEKQSDVLKDVPNVEQIIETYDQEIVENTKKSDQEGVEWQNMLKPEDVSSPIIEVIIREENEPTCDEANLSLNILCEEAAKRQAESQHEAMKAKKRLFTEELYEETVITQNVCIEESKVANESYSYEVPIEQNMPQRDEELVIGWQSYNDERVNGGKSVISEEIFTQNGGHMIMKQEGHSVLEHYKELNEKMPSKPKCDLVNVLKKPFTREVRKQQSKSKIQEVKSAKQQYDKIMEEIEKDRRNDVKHDEVFGEQHDKKQNPLNTGEHAYKTTRSYKNRARAKIDSKMEEIVARKRPYKNEEESVESKNKLAVIFEIPNTKNFRKLRHHESPRVGRERKEQYTSKCGEVSEIFRKLTHEESVESTSESENETDNTAEEQDEWRYTMKNEELAILERHINSQIISNRNHLKNVSDEEYIKMLKKEQELKGKRTDGGGVGIFEQGDHRQRRKLDLRVVLEKFPKNVEQVFVNLTNKVELDEVNEVRNKVGNNRGKKVVKLEKKDFLSKKKGGIEHTEKMAAPTYGYRLRATPPKRKNIKRLTKSRRSKPKFQNVDNLKNCAMCEKSFKSKGDLVKHIRTHTGEKPHQCVQCNKSFAQKGNLVKHEMIHTGEKPYECIYCESTFGQKIHMMEHMRSHTGERPYPCQYCEKRFRKKTHLEEHTRIHTGYKPYECPYCQKCFTLNINYKNHINIHTGEMAYKCAVCMKPFNLRSDLIRHNRKHTGEKPFQCGVCKFRFSLKNNLKKHLKSQHNLMEFNHILANSC